MEEYEEYEEGGGSTNKILIAVIVLLLLAIAAGCVYFFFIRKEPESNNGPGYATNAVVALTQEELDAALKAAAGNAAGGNISLKYKNNAYSDDGINFECYIINSADNLYDMFLAIYADAELTDQLYLSGLVPRGSGFNELTLDHALEKGTHTVYVVLTQVNTEEDGTETIVRQITHTMDFHVS